MTFIPTTKNPGDSQLMPFCEIDWTTGIEHNVVQIDKRPDQNPEVISAAFSNDMISSDTVVSRIRFPWQ
jgi:hypothetical protein